MASASSSDAVPGRRERKKLETRTRLESAALDLFEERGYDATTVEDVTEAADVAVRTFFRYFPTKESLLVGPTEEALMVLAAALDARPPAEGPYAAVVGCLRSLSGEEFRAQEETVLRRLRLALSVPGARAGVLESWSRWEDVLARRLGARSSALDPFDARVVAAGVMAAFRVAASAWVDEVRAGSLEELFTRAARQIGSGLDAVAAE